MHHWSQPHLNWRMTFNTEIFKTSPVVRYGPSMNQWIASYDTWMNFSKEQIAPLCKSEIDIRKGSWSVYFACKNDVACVKLMLAEYVQCAQSKEEFESYGGYVIPDDLIKNTCLS